MAKAGRTTEQREADKIKQTVDEKIDEFNEETFPASDPPAWSSLRRLAKKAKALSSGRDLKAPIDNVK